MPALGRQKQQEDNKFEVDLNHKVRVLLEANACNTQHGQGPRLTPQCKRKGEG